MSEQTRKFLIHVRFGSSAPNKVLEATKLMLAAIKRLSGGEHVLAYTSEDAGTFGVIASINKPAAVIRAALDGTGNRAFELAGLPTRNDHDDTGFRSEDSIFILELGTDCSSTGFAKPETWMKNH